MKVDFSSIQTEKILLGRTGENERTQVQINCAAVYAEYPSAVASLVAKAPNGDKYPVATTVSNNAVIWDVLDSMLVHTGVGEYQLTFTLGDVVAKSAIGKFVVTQSIEADGSMPSVIEDWMQEANEALGGIPNQVADAVDDYVSENWSSWSGALDRTLSSSQSAAPADMVGDLKSVVDTKADKDGTHEDLTAGNALYLLSDRGDTDVAPYVFRKTGGAKNGYGREFMRKIVGGTVAWNQLAASNSEVFPANENRNTGIAFFTGIVGHKYIFAATQENSITSNIRNMFVITWNNSAQTDYETGALENANLTKGTRFVMFSCPEGGSSAFRVWVHTPNVDVTYDKPMIFDLTQMFGSTIADAIYAMEQATAGSGVAWFRSLFPNDYYAYDAGSLQSVQEKEHRTVGFNLFDKSTVENNKRVKADGSIVNDNGYLLSDYIPVESNKEYYFKNISAVSYTITGVAYDANKQFIGRVTGNSVHMFTTPNNARYVRINNMTVDVDTQCINISDPSKNGTYEPYESHTYPLDSSLTLRGIPKWDSTNGLYYDGDEYTADGKVTRKYGIVDLGTLNWDKSGSFTPTRFLTQDLKTLIKAPSSSALANVIVPGYQVVTQSSTWNIDKTLAVITTGDLYIMDNSYSDAATFKTAMSGVYLVYELATPTTESADPYRELEICSKGGTEEFVDAGVTATTPTRDVSIPVGTETFYPVDIWHLIDELTALVLEN